MELYLSLGSFLLPSMWQSLYLPLHPRNCWDAQNWRNGTDGRNLFVEGTKKEAFGDFYRPGGLCFEMVWNMQMAFVVGYELFTGVDDGVLIWDSFVLGFISIYNLISTVVYGKCKSDGTSMAEWKIY